MELGQLKLLAEQATRVRSDSKDSTDEEKSKPGNTGGSREHVASVASATMSPGFGLPFGFLAQSFVLPSSRSSTSTTTTSSSSPDLSPSSAPVVWNGSGLLSMISSSSKRPAMAVSEAEETGKRQRMLFDDQQSNKGLDALGLASDCPVLDLRGCDLGDSGSITICAMLLSENGLVELNLQDNELGDSGIRFIAQGLKGQNAHLRRVNLRNNSIGAMGAVDLAEALKWNCTLQELDLLGNSIGSEGAQALGDALVLNSALRKLNLANNKIKDNGAKAIGQALCVNVALKQLDLIGNEIGPSGAYYVIYGIRNVGVLSFEDNLLGNMGAQVIGNALKTKGLQLEHLNLGYNSIGNSGAQTLGSALMSSGSNNVMGTNSRSFGSLQSQVELQSGINSMSIEDDMGAMTVERPHSGLKELNLKKNGISDVGAQALAEGLQYCSKIKELDLEGNQIQSSGFLSLLLCLRQANKTLRKLKLGYNRPLVNDLPVVSSTNAISHPLTPQQSTTNLNRSPPNTPLVKPEPSTLEANVAASTARTLSSSTSLSGSLVSAAAAAVNRSRSRMTRSIKSSDLESMDMEDEQDENSEAQSGGYTESDDVDDQDKSEGASCKDIGAILTSLATSSPPPPSRKSSNRKVVPETMMNTLPLGTKSRRQARKWTLYEDELLREAVKKHGLNNWKKLAEEIPNRDHNQCRGRWKAIRPGLVKGSWSHEEDKLLRDIVMNTKGVLNWTAIAKRVKGRNAKQCRERWFTKLDPSIKNTPWNDEEDKRLLELVKTMGGRWSLIARRIPGRTEIAVKNRFHSLLRRENKVAKE